MGEERQDTKEMTEIPTSPWGQGAGIMFHQVHDDDDESEHNVVEYLWILRKLA